MPFQCITYYVISVQFMDEETLCPGPGEHVIMKIQGALVIIISVSVLEAEMSDNTTSRLLSISDGYEFPDNQFFTASITLQNGVVTSNTIELEFSK